MMGCSWKCELGFCRKLMAFKPASAEKPLHTFFSEAPDGWNEDGEGRPGRRP